jgi:transposase
MYLPVQRLTKFSSESSNVARQRGLAPTGNWLKVHRLPPYSQEFNPTERLGKYLISPSILYTGFVKRRLFKGLAEAGCAC